VVKFNPDSGGWIETAGKSSPSEYIAHKALKVYQSGLSPFTGSQPIEVYVPSASTSCICRSPRFEVDPYGRIYFPHTVIGKITIADNEANEIIQFGEYGNMDSRGPGSMVPGPEFPMAWPAGVAASEDYIYITDLVNAHVLRIKMNYALDNIPGFTDKKGPRNSLLNTGRMYARPNPFNSQVIIQFTPSFGDKEPRMDIFSIVGKKIRTLTADRRGISSAFARVVWDGRNQAGHTVPSGIYVCRYKGFQRHLTLKICYLK
jgi:hypothetical protein